MQRRKEIDNYGSYSITKNSNNILDQGQCPSTHQYTCLTKHDFVSKRLEDETPEISTAESQVICHLGHTKVSLLRRAA